MLTIALLAQLPGSNQAGTAENTIINTLELSRATSGAWDQAWQTIFRTSAASGEVGLWLALVRFALILGAVSILFLALKEGKEILARQSWSDLVTMFVYPLVVMFFLSGNGQLLANTVLLMRQVATIQIREVLEIQVGGLTFNQAISNVALSQAGRTQIEAIYLECRDKTGDALLACWNDPAKREAVERIVSAAEQANQGTLNSLQRFAQAILNGGEGINVAEFITVPLLKLVETLLWALTWAFLNALEAALLVTALFAPISMALSVLPLGSKPIWAWGIGFMSLFGMQLGWNLLVGLVASILVIAEAQAISDLAFPVFIAIFAPVLVTFVSGGGGIALYNALNNSGGAVFNGLSNLTGAVTSLVIRRM